MLLLYHSHIHLKVSLPDQHRAHIVRREVEIWKGGEWLKKKGKYVVITATLVPEANHVEEEQLVKVKDD